jgi:hypothetical protein
MATEFLPEDYGFSYPPRLPPRAAIEAAVETLVEVLNAMDGDSDEEENGDELDGTRAEDEAGAEFYARPMSGPGCLIADDDSAVDDRPCDDINMDLEPEHDAEIETWSHPDDHPAELFIGRRQ